MRHVLFVPETKPAEDSVTLMLNAVWRGLKAEIRPLGQLANLADGEIPVLSAVYTDESRLPMAAIIASKRPCVIIDHSWFGEPHMRGRYFRIVADGFQPKQL